MSDTARTVCDWLDYAAPGVRGLQPYLPGKPIEELRRELGLDDIVKLASNENPLGPSPLALNAARDALGEISRYPDGGGFRLKAALARHHGVDPDGVTLGNGSNDVLEMVARVFLAGPSTAGAFAAHAFAVYPIAVQAAGAIAQVGPALPKDHPRMPFGHDLDALLACLTAATRVVFIANPNNPTGTWVEADALLGFLRAVPRSVIVVVDEAYLEYVNEADFPDASRWLGEFPNLVVTRTFSKIHGLAGLRVGYALSHPDVANLLNRVRQPFNVSLPALAAAEAALADVAHIERSRLLNSAGLLQLQAGFERLGLRVLPSRGNFLCVDLRVIAQPVFEALLRLGVIVRPVANYGLPTFLRVSVGSSGENARCLAAFAEVLRRD
ncbi:MAG: histidinol-phosphate transaminase [Thiotrichales bacterium]